MTLVKRRKDMSQSSKRNGKQNSQGLWAVAEMSSKQCVRFATLKFQCHMGGKTTLLNIATHLLM